MTIKKGVADELTDGELLLGPEITLGSGDSPGTSLTINLREAVAPKEELASCLNVSLNRGETVSILLLLRKELEFTNPEDIALTLGKGTEMNRPDSNPVSLSMPLEESVSKLIELSMREKEPVLVSLLPAEVLENESEGGVADTAPNPLTLSLELGVVEFEGVRVAGGKTDVLPVAFCLEESVAE